MCKAIKELMEEFGCGYKTILHYGQIGDVRPFPKRASAPSAEYYYSDEDAEKLREIRRVLLSKPRTPIHRHGNSSPPDACPLLCPVSERKYFVPIRVDGVKVGNLPVCERCRELDQETEPAKIHLLKVEIERAALDSYAAQKEKANLGWRSCGICRKEFAISELVYDDRAKVGRFVCRACRDKAVPR